MVPSAYEFLRELPRTPAGKTDRQALQAPKASQAGPGAEAAGDLESLVADIWSQVLGLDAAGLDDNFFALGGDSLKAVAVADILRKHGFAPRVAEIFENPTVRALAGLLSGEGRPALRIPEDGEPYELSTQQAVMLENQAPGVYHLQHRFRLRDESFSEQAVRAAFGDIVAHNPALRLRFRGGGRQQVDPEAPGGRTVFRDIRGTPEADREGLLAAQMREDRTRPFSDGGLYRFHVHRLSEDTFEILASFHHAMMDGWSVGVLLRQWLGFYNARKAGEAPTGPSAENVHRQFVALQRESAASGPTRAFWRDYLDGARPHRLASAPSRRYESAQLSGLPAGGLPNGGLGRKRAQGDSFRSAQRPRFVLEHGAVSPPFEGGSPGASFASPKGPDRHGTAHPRGSGRTGIVFRHLQPRRCRPHPFGGAA